VIGLRCENYAKSGFRQALAAGADIVGAHSLGIKKWRPPASAGGKIVPMAQQAAEKPWVSEVAATLRRHNFNGCTTDLAA
jgi:hypothetical protein